jgi:ABC-type nitrate/sulfonate/bicarbonate transport system substrate-binding protein
MKLAPLLLLFCALITWSPPDGHAQELRRLLYGVSTSISHLPVWVGKDTGLFGKNGLNVEPVQIRGGALSTMTIMSGQAVLSGVGAG